MDSNIKTADQKNLNIHRNTWFVWFIAVFVLTAAALLAYAAAQQALRLSANYPQVQMAQDGAASIAAGKSAESVAAGDKVNIAASLAPFVIVYDAGGNVVASSGLLNGEAPKIPAGVLEYTLKNGEDRVSWTPDKSIRIAAVVVNVEGGQGGFVLAGRSLKETESIIDKIGFLLLAMWAGSMVFLHVAFWIYRRIMKKKG